MKKLLTLLLSFVIVCVNPITTMANAIVTIERSDNTPYVFPVVPGSSEWEKFISKQDMVDACQVPEDKLKNMTTEALLETVLNYPLITDYIAFNTFEDACNMVSSDFNGFNELFSREDVTSVILNRYATSNVLYEINDNTDSKRFMEPATIEYLIVCNEIKNGKMNDEEAKQFAEIHNEKVIDRYQAEIYSANSEVYLLQQAGGTTKARAGEILTPVPVGTVKTPKGTNVQDVYQRSPEVTDAEKEMYTREIDSRYPHTSKLSEATVNYNCHSYAWYSTSTSNPYWIGFYIVPDMYMTDGSYIQTTSNSLATGTKMWYNNGEHSAIFRNYMTILGSVTMAAESKWGMCGLYSHPYNHCPYYSEAGSITYWIRNNS